MGKQSHLHLIILLLCTTLVQAQGPRRAVLRAGDTLYLSRDLLPNPIDLLPSGIGQSWDMSQLLAPFVQKSLVRPDGKGGFIFTGPDDIERYLIERPEGLFLVHFGIPQVQGGRRMVSLDPPLPLITETEPGTSWEYTGTMTYSSPAAGGNSVLNLRVQGNLDAKGELNSPTGRYDVVRERRDVEITQPSGAKVTKDLLLPPGLCPGRSYAYISTASPIPVAVVSTDGQEHATQVEYQTQPWAGDVVDQIPRKPDVLVYPNPSFGNVRFDFLNLSPGYYDLAIYNILGMQVRTERVYVSGSKTLPMDLSRLKRGTYIYRLVDSQNNTIRSKRLVIITP